MIFKHLIRILLNLRYEHYSHLFRSPYFSFITFLLQVTNIIAYYCVI